MRTVYFRVTVSILIYHMSFISYLKKSVVLSLFHYSTKNTKENLIFIFGNSDMSWSSERKRKRKSEVQEKKREDKNLFIFNKKKKFQTKTKRK